MSRYFTNNRPLQMVAICAQKGDKVEIPHCIKGADKHFRRLAKALWAEDVAKRPSVVIPGPYSPEFKVFLGNAVALSKKVSRKNNIKEVKLREDFLRRNFFNVLEKTPESINFYTKRIIDANPDTTPKFKQSETYCSKKEKFTLKHSVDDDRKLVIKQAIIYLPDEEIDKIKKGGLRAKFDELWAVK